MFGHVGVAVASGLVCKSGGGNCHATLSASLCVIILLGPCCTAHSTASGRNQTRALVYVSGDQLLLFGVAFAFLLARV